MSSKYFLMFTLVHSLFIYGHEATATPPNPSSATRGIVYVSGPPRSLIEGAIWYDVQDQIEDIQKQPRELSLDQKTWLHGMFKNHDHPAVRAAARLALDGPPNTIKTRVRFMIYDEYAGGPKREIIVHTLKFDEVEALQEIADFDIDQDFAIAARRVLSGLGNYSAFGFFRVDTSFDIQKLLNRFKGRFLNANEQAFLFDLYANHDSESIRRQSAEILEKVPQPRGMIDSQIAGRLRWRILKGKDQCEKLLAWANRLPLP